MSNKKYIVSWHCEYKSGKPTSVGGCLGVYGSRDEAKCAIVSTIDEDIERYRDWCRESGIDFSLDEFFHSYDGSDEALTCDCEGYSDIDNEIVYYYISEMPADSVGN